jgi:hypothetical protein
LTSVSGLSVFSTTSESLILLSESKISSFTAALLARWFLEMVSLMLSLSYSILLTPLPLLLRFLPYLDISVDFEAVLMTCFSFIGFTVLFSEGRDYEPSSSVGFIPVISKICIGRKNIQFLFALIHT